MHRRGRGDGQFSYPFHWGLSINLKKFSMHNYNLKLSPLLFFWKQAQWFFNYPPWSNQHSLFNDVKSTHSFVRVRSLVPSNAQKCDCLKISCLFLQSIAPPGGQMLDEHVLDPLLLCSARGYGVQNEESKAIRQIDSSLFHPDLVYSLITCQHIYAGMINTLGRIPQSLEAGMIF